MTHPASLMSGNTAIRLSRQVSVAPPAALTPRVIVRPKPSKGGWLAGKDQIGADAAMDPSTMFGYFMRSQAESIPP